MKVESKLTLVNIINEALVGKFVVITIGDSMVGMGEVARVVVWKSRVEQAFCVEFKSGGSATIPNLESTIIKVLGEGE